MESAWKFQVFYSASYKTIVKFKCNSVENESWSAGKKSLNSGAFWEIIWSSRLVSSLGSLLAKSICYPSRADFDQTGLDYDKYLDMSVNSKGCPTIVHRKLCLKHNTIQCKLSYLDSYLLLPFYTINNI